MRYVLTDFERAAISAINEIFPEAVAKGCSFHYRQAGHNATHTAWMTEGRIRLTGTIPATAHMDEKSDGTVRATILCYSHHLELHIFRTRQLGRCFTVRRRITLTYISHLIGA